VKSLVSGLALLLMFMVAARSQSPDSTEAGGSLKMSFEYASNRNSLLVRVRINGKPALLILDTGSAHTVLRPDAAGVPRSELAPVRTSRSNAGFMGDAMVREVKLQVGHHMWSRRRVVVMDISDILAAYPEKPDGLLGLDFFQPYARVVMDFQERTITLTR